MLYIEAEVQRNYFLFCCHSNNITNVLNIGPVKRYDHKLHYLACIFQCSFYSFHDCALFYNINMLQSHSVKHVLTLVQNRKEALDLGGLPREFVCEAELHEPLVSYADFFFQLF